ncbi:MAG: hypothetical protein IKU71_00125 [Kiritimatiellae bacterium]|nr:hypothetical protein [Kiritimatiellia bacterium]
MERNDVTVFQQSLMACGDPVEIARKVKLAFKKMPGEMALACFAKVMTADLPHPIKVAVWDAVRYSHIWWGVDEVLQGAVMENPTVQQAFADAVPMRKWFVGRRSEGYEGVCMTLGPEIVFTQGFVQSDLHRLIFLITHFSDEDAAERIRSYVAIHRNAASITNYLDMRGNNLLWYLTYRDDQNARGGFACPCIEGELLWIGVDPNRRNNLGLCWNDVKRHVIRPNQ